MKAAHRRAHWLLWLVLALAILVGLGLALSLRPTVLHHTPVVGVDSSFRQATETNP
ncbi:MAG: hypothetical protein ACFCBW_09885 [Candidatus Competibacterales bacterium]